MIAALRTLFLSAFLLSAFCAPAYASVSLSEADVQKFVSAIGDVEAFSEQMQKEGKNEELEKAIAPKSGDDTFQPYEKGVVYMKEKLPEDYKKLGAISNKHGFASQEDWAKISDSVMHAYMALRFERDNPNALQQLRDITPEMKAQLPPPALAQLERQAGILKSLNSIPPANKEAVKPHVAKIDEWLARAEEKDKQTEGKPAPTPAAH